MICTSMALNIMFFFDSSMHKIYLDYGKYNFIHQIPQIIYSSLVSLLMDILIIKLLISLPKLIKINYFVILFF